jgi:hypothetical protein
VPTLVVRLRPEKLTNPNADLRYLVPRLLCERCEGNLQEDGYCYEDDSALLLYLEADTPEQVLPQVWEILETEPVLGNTLALAAEIWVEETGRRF